MSIPSRRGRCRRLFLYPVPLILLLAHPLPAAANGDPLGLEGLRVLEIHFQGNEHIADETVHRELFLQTGDAFRRELLDRDLNFLKGLGLFADVDVNVSVDSRGVKLYYRIVERGEIRYGLIYPVGNVSGGKLQAGLVYRHRNLFGAREYIWIQTTYGYEKFFEFRLGRPWIRNLPLQQEVEYLRIDREDPNDYNYDRIRFNLWVSMDRRRPLEHRFLFSVSWGELRYIDGNRRLFEKEHGIILGYSRDTRDSFIRPTRGLRLSAAASMYDPRLLGSSVSLLQLDIFLGIVRRLPGGFIGALAMDHGTRYGTLFYRRSYSLGGMDSVRGFPSGYLNGWTESGWPAGPNGDGVYTTPPVTDPVGRNRLLARSELRRELFGTYTFDTPIVGVWDIAGEWLLFGDMGWLWARKQPVPPDEGGYLIYGGGVGLRIYVPFGDVLRAEFGYGSHGDYRIHLGSGLRF
jgi:outer membrane protein assembly factor BamA